MADAAPKGNGFAGCACDYQEGYPKMESVIPAGLWHAYFLLILCLNSADFLILELIEIGSGSGYFLELSIFCWLHQIFWDKHNQKVPGSLCLHVSLSLAPGEGERESIGTRLNATLVQRETFCYYQLFEVLG